MTHSPILKWSMNDRHEWVLIPFVRTDKGDVPVSRKPTTMPRKDQEQ